MDATYGAYVDDACFDIRDYDDDNDHNTDGDADDDTDDDTDDGGRGNMYTIAYSGALVLDLVWP